MSKTNRITKRLPQWFFKAREEDSITYNLVMSIAKMLDQIQADYIGVMKTHWVEHASGVSLDKLGALFELKREDGEDDDPYRSRIKSAVRDYRGGGTFEAITLTIRKTLELPQDFKIILNPSDIKLDHQKIFVIENPSKPVSSIWEVKLGETWSLENKSILEAVPNISIHVVAGVFDQSRFDYSMFASDELVNPVVTNIDTGESITFRGIVSPGQTLYIHLENNKAKAELDALDLTDFLKGVIPRLPTGSSTWRCEEGLGGVFDQSRFDHSTFSIVNGVFDETTFDYCEFKRTPSLVMKFGWVEYEPATFEVKVPTSLVQSIPHERLVEAINEVKASGIRAKVDYWFDVSEQHEPATQMEVSASCHAEISEGHKQTSQLEVSGSCTLEIEDTHATDESFETLLGLTQGAFDQTMFDQCVFC